MLYDIDNTNHDIARDYMRASDKKRFRIVMEIAKGCYGNCEGCSLSALDRKNQTPAMSIEQVRENLAYFVPLINEKKHLNTAVVNLGVGDYFMLDEVYLEALFQEISVFFSHIHTQRKLLTVSTSLFAIPEKMQEKIAAMTKHIHVNQFALDVVLDPFRMVKQYSRYSQNIDYLTQYFPFVDFVVNISNHIEVSQLDSLMEFLKSKRILNIDIQYAINNTNYYRVKIAPDNFKSFIDKFYQNFQSDIMDLSISQSVVSQDNTVFDEMQQNADEIVNERLFVNERGEIYPVAYALGDIILDERYDMPLIGTTKTSFDSVSAKQQIAKQLKSIFLKNKVCHTCPYNKNCYATGYAFYNKFTDDVKKCDNIGRYYFEK